MVEKNASCRFPVRNTFVSGFVRKKESARWLDLKITISPVVERNDTFLPAVTKNAIFLAIPFPVLFNCYAVSPVPPVETLKYPAVLKTLLSVLGVTVRATNDSSVEIRYIVMLLRSVTGLASNQM